MTRKLLTSSVALFFTGLSITYVAQAQDPLTGSRIASAGGSTPRTVIQMHEPEEFAAIRRLLSRGEIDEARSLALGYVDKVEKGGMDIFSRYYAYNALCVTYTYSGEAAEAEEECSRAIRTNPGHWSAWNNRGTARMLSGNFDGAQEDYSKAKEMAGSSRGISDLLDHNIELLQDRRQN